MPFPPPSSVPTFCDLHPAPYLLAILALGLEYCPVLLPPRSPLIRQTHGFPAVPAVQLPVEVGQTRRRSNQSLLVLWVQAIALCGRPCLLDRMRPVYIGVPG